MEDDEYDRRVVLSLGAFLAPLFMVVAIFLGGYFLTMR
jgi:hypothetical protein